MIGFLLSLLPFAIADGASATRLAILALLLGSKEKPVRCGAMYLAGTYLVYTIYGMLFVLGLATVFEKFASGAGGDVADRIINPHSIDYVISFVIGILFLFGTWHFSKPPKPKKEKEDEKGVTPRGSFVLGAVTNAIVGPGILPSFAAYTQIMKSPFSTVTCLVILFTYNFLVISPLVFLFFLRIVNEDRADRVFASIASFLSTWGRRFVFVLFLLLGLVMIADSVGFFFGYPLIPTGDGGSGE